MGQPSAFEVAQKTGFLGGAGRNRHRMAMMNQQSVEKPAKKSTPLPAKVKTISDDAEPDPFDSNEAAKGEAAPAAKKKRSAAHLGAFQFKALKSMQNKKGRFGH